MCKIWQCETIHILTWESMRECMHILRCVCVQIYIEHGNLETRKTLTTSQFRCETFLLPLSLKVLRHKERDTHSFYSGFSICPPSRAVPAARKFVSPLRAPKVDPSRLVSSFQLNELTFSKPPKSSARFRCVTSPAFWCPVTHLGYCNILSDTPASPAHAREHLRLCCT